MGLTVQEKVQIEYRRTQVAELYLKKWKQAAIARELGVSQATISNDLKAIRKEWMKSRIHNYDEAIIEEDKSIELVEREAWEGWQRSQKPIETTRIIQKNGEKRAEKTVRECAGDPRFLRIVLSAKEKRHKLLGLSTAARAAFEASNEQTVRDKRLYIDWDSIFERMNSKTVVIDDDYIQKLVDKEIQESVDHADGEKNSKECAGAKRRSS